MLGIRRYQGVAIDLFEGDLTAFACDAMVTAANSRLDGGGEGVSGAIHRAAGPSIAAECQAIGGCAVGDAVVTAAGLLPTRWLIHAVGPLWEEGCRDAPALLKSAYQASLRHADKLAVRHVAFSAISTGACAYPPDKAAVLAMTALKEHLELKKPYDVGSSKGLARVTFVLFSRDHYHVFQNALFVTFPDLD